MFELIQRNGVVTIVFREDFVPLSEIQKAVDAHFPGVNRNGFWLESPNYTWNQDWYLLICNYPEMSFIDHGDHLSSQVNPYISLGQIEDQLAPIGVSPETVKVFWSRKNELCLSLQKGPGEYYHGGEECACCHRLMCKCSGEIAHCVTRGRRVCQVCCSCSEKH